MADVPTTVRRHRCPRCGSRLASDDGSVLRKWLRHWVLLRYWRCTPDCGWRGYRFSRSQYRQRKRQLRRIALTVLLGVLVVLVVRYALSHATGAGGGAHDDGVQETE